MKAVVEQDPEDPQRLNHRLGVDLATICLKCLAKQPDRRYATAAAVADDLDRWLNHESILARPAAGFEVLDKWARRNPVKAFAASAIVVGAMVVYGLTLQSREALRIQRDAAQQLADERDIEAKRAQAAENRMRLAIEERTAQLNRVEYAEANERFAAADALKGLATLSKILRRSPDYAPARDRALLELPRLARPKPAAPPMNAKGIDAAVFSPDGSRLYVASTRSISAWDVRTGERLWNAHGHTDRINRMAVSPDGGLLASSSLDRTARVWNAATGAMAGELFNLGGRGREIGFTADGRELTATAWPPRGSAWPVPSKEPSGAPIVIASRKGFRITTLLFSPSGDYWFAADSNHEFTLTDRRGNSLIKSSSKGFLGDSRVWFSRSERVAAICGTPRAIEVWSISDAKRVHRLVYPSVIADVVWSLDDQFLHVGLDDGTVQTLNLEDSEPVGRILRHSTHIIRLDLSHDGRRLLALTENQRVTVWTLAGGNRTLQLPDNLPVKFAMFSPVEGLLATIEPDGAARCWRLSDPDTGESTLRLERPIQAVEFSPGSRTVAVGTTDNGVSVFRVADGVHVGVNDAVGRNPFDIRAANEKPIFAAGGKGKRLLFLDAASGKTVTGPISGFGWLDKVRFSADDRFVAVLHYAKSLHLIDTQTGKRPWNAIKHPTYTPDADFTEDGRIVVTACIDGRLRFFNVADGKPARKPIKLPNGIEDLEFSPDDTRLLAAQTAGGAMIVDWRTGEPEHRLPQEGWITAVRYSPDGGRVFTASRSGIVRIWNTKTGEAAAPPLKHDGGVETIALTPSGRRLVTGSGAGDVTLWDARTGDFIGRLARHGAEVKRVRVSRDGRWAASGSQDGTVRICRLPPELPEAAAAPDWLPDYIEARVGLRLDETSTPQYLDSDLEAADLIPVDAKDAVSKAIRQRLTPQ